ncbi:MAG TPA: sulfotransferase family protein [Gammaproteobacteria bacterium]|nr:sulfotransferase family protein [Gammaproteobacteria bacterium]
MAKENTLTRARRKKGYAALAAGDNAAAARAFAQVCAHRPHDAEARCMLGIAQARQGQWREAAGQLRQALRFRPDFPEAHLNLGQVLELSGDLAGAEHHFRAALAARPELADAAFSLGRVLLHFGRFAEAERSFAAGLAQQGDRVDALVLRGRALHQQGYLPQARALYEQALSLAPESASALCARAAVQADMGELETALTGFRRAQALAPDFLEARIGEVSTLERLGETATAQTRLAALLPAHGAEPLVLLARARLEPPGSAALIADLQQALADPGLSATETEYLSFALGDALDAAGDYEGAWKHYQRANRCHGADFDGDAFAARMAARRQNWQREALRGAARAGHGSTRPVFIVGMPRSGTTLVEQIVSSHPQVAGGGELETLPSLINEMSAACGRAAESLAPEHFSAADLEHYAGCYLAELERLAPGARRVTDKLPQNFINLGLISLLFPQARVIHCRRHPLDTCLSCYTHNFSARHPYSYDLDDLARYYREYRRLMAHWADTLPLALLTVDYEDLVREPETVSRRLIDFLGLPFDPRCLAPHTNPRRVLTASYRQVRRPVYGSAVGRWQHYARHLAPLQALVEEEGAR